MKTKNDVHTTILQRISHWVRSGALDTLSGIRSLFEDLRKTFRLTVRQCKAQVRGYLQAA